MDRGDLYWVNLEPSSPPEFGKSRPGLIVSNSIHNRALSSLVIVPLSSRPKAIWPLRLDLGETKGLANRSFAVLAGLRQVSKQRLGERIGAVSEVCMDHIEEALKAYLGP